MRHLAIGDIHGCSRAFELLLALVAPTPEDLIITLGDYVDRGPDSRAVMERLLALHRTGRLIAIRGNHEEIMMRARTGGNRIQAFLRVGGGTTLASYAAAGKEGTLADVPDEHWDFMENVCRDIYELPTHFFVHANVKYYWPLADQPASVLRWEEFNDPPPHVSGKIMLCGHTPQKSGLPRNIGHALCIDTFAWGGGWLTCVDVMTGQMWQTNEKGESREGRV